MKAFVLSMAVLVLPAVATAQEAPVPQYPVATMHQPVFERSPFTLSVDPMGQADKVRERLLLARAGSPEERRERAARLAALVNAGECEAARRDALAEHDLLMADRIAEVCTASGSGG